MQKLFSMFPTGAPGAALLLLRICAVAALFMSHGGSFAIPGSLWGIIVNGLLAVALLLGFLTPVFAVVCALMHLVVLIRAEGTPLFFLLNTFVAASLALLGPGAYSLDAQLFGRRIVVLDTHPND